MSDVTVTPTPMLQSEAPARLSLELALAQIAARADSLDGAPRFPSENLESLRSAGIPQLAADRARCTLMKEIALIRAVAGADASTARILDGHFNGVERLSLTAPPGLREEELGAVARGALLFGVWGADPGPGEGPAAKIEENAEGILVLRGVKTFCSGAGGVQRALVVAHDDSGARRVAYIDAGRALRIDRQWYRASGLRSSESHRVEFLDTPILALLGAEDELIREPHFSRDGVRTAATWAGLADCILRATLSTLQGRQPDDLQLHAVGLMRVAQSTIDRSLQYAGTYLDPLIGDPEETDFQLHQAPAAPGWETAALAAESRLSIVQAAREIAAQATRACGSRALANGGLLDRARRDLDLFVLQHRLDPKLVSLGRQALERVSR